MSRLSERIQKTSRPAPRPIGFGPRVTTHTSMLLLARLTAPKGEASLKGNAEGIDAALLAATDLTDEKVTALGGIPCGLQTASLDLITARRWKQAGIDYVVFDPQATDAASLLEEGLGFVMAVAEDAPEDLLRWADGFGLDALYVARQEGPLTVRRQMALRRLAILTRLPLLVSASADTSAEAIESLRNAGAIGVVVDLEGWADLPLLAPLRQRIVALPGQRPRRAERPEAVLPVPTLAPQPSEEEEVEEPE